MSSHEGISLVVCTLGRPVEVKRLLTSLASLSHKPQEVLIIDASRDSRTEVVSKECGGQSLVPNLCYFKVSSQHCGLTRQRNYGVDRASGDIVAFLDDDTIPEANYFGEIAECFQRHPDALGVGGTIANETLWQRTNRTGKDALDSYRFGEWERREDIRRRLRKLFALESPLPPGWMPGFGHGRPADFPPDGQDYPVEFMMGGVSSWRKLIFSKQRFSEFFVGYGLYEDLDFCVRAAARGKLYVSTRARVAHYHAPAARPNQFRYGVMVVRNGWFVWRRRWPKPELTDRCKWWATTALLGLCRAGNAVFGPKRVQALTETAGRFCGMGMVLFNPPRKQVGTTECLPLRPADQLRMRTEARDLVLLRLDGDRVVAIRLFHSGQWAELTVGNKSANLEFRRLIEQFPDSLIAWCDGFLEPYLAPPEEWPRLLNHNLEVLHAGALHQCPALARSIGLVDWHSPFILGPPRQTRYPTWMASPWAGIGHASLFLGLGFEPALTRFIVALWDCVGRGIRYGVCPYSEPRLIAAEPPAALVQSQRKPISSGGIAVLVRRIYGPKWVLFWLVGSALSCNSLPLLAALRSLLSSAAGALSEPNVDVLRPPLDAVSLPASKIDVIIPTLGRPDFLVQALEDLAAQELLPAKVFVVEQQPGDPSPVLAERLAARKWPFQVIHHRVSWTGACKARNLALREVTGNWVLMLDDDIRLTRGFLRYMVSVARAYRVEVVNGATYLPGEFDKQAASRPMICCWAGFATGSSLVSRRLIEAAGGFDERGEGGFGEDTEYGIRLRLCGGNILYAPAEPILHLKAPVGGFRYTFPHPWLKEKVQPRPSPTYQYYMRKHTSRTMQFGYAQYYFLKRLASLSFYEVPLQIPKIIAQWCSSVRWAEKLAERQA